MKKLVLITFLIILCFAGETHSQQRNIRNPKMGDTVLLYDWNRDGVKDTFIVKNRVYYNSVYPKYFSYDDLVIKMSNGKTFKLSENSSLVSEGMETEEVPCTYVSYFDKNNIIPNHYFWLLSLSKAIKPMLFVKAANLETSEDSPSFIVINLDSNGMPGIVFEKQYYYSSNLEDLDNDGIKEIIGSSCFSQCDNPNICAYVPINVYKYRKGKFQIDEKLSKKYNSRYVNGWAGLECSEDWVVLNHPKLKKPKVMKYKEAKKLLKRLNNGKDVWGDEDQ